MRLRTARSEEHAAEVKALCDQALNLERELADMKRREAERENLAKEQEMYLQQLEKVLADQRVIAEDLQRSYDEARTDLA